MKRMVAIIAAGLVAGTLAAPAMASKKADPAADKKGAPAAAKAAANKKAEAWKTYGADITLKKTAKLAKAGLGTEVLVHGKIIEVCQNKGCWMTVADGKDEVRVEFKDYGFFVPWDSEGKAVHLQGVLTEKMLSPEEQAHIAAESKGRDEDADADEDGDEDGDLDDEDDASAGPKKIRVFVASGVAIQGGGEIGEEQKRKIGGAKPAHDHRHDHHHDHSAPGHKH